MLFRSILNQTLAYEVDQIQTVLPDQTESLAIEEGKDYVTLVTCTQGISESNQAAIFRRFYREEEVHEQQGVGIGLYLAREIVTRQGGYIKVVSEPGKGSEFSIMLPTK